MKKLNLIFIALLTIGNCIGFSQNNVKNTIVEISTEFGIIKIKLYNETPLHRDNFIKLIKQGWYNGSVFHRVIKGFMIQGGNGANGSEDPGYTIPAEINPMFFHKRGALCAARMPDQVNPKKESSGSQFYIVQGEVMKPEQVKMWEQRLNRTFTDAQKKAYTTVGGAPHLDGDYTVFGEVIEGMDVVDKIAAVAVNPADNYKPVKNIKMTVRIIQ